MHTRTIMAIVIILVLFVTFIQPRLWPNPPRQELFVTTQSEVTIVPTTSWGSVEIAAGDTSTAVTHDLGQLPAQVLLTSNGQPDIAVSMWWVSDITSAGFDVNIDASASSTTAFFWQAIPPPQ